MPASFSRSVRSGRARGITFMASDCVARTFVRSERGAIGETLSAASLLMSCGGAKGADVASSDAAQAKANNSPASPRRAPRVWLAVPASTSAVISVTFRSRAICLPRLLKARARASVDFRSLASNSAQARGVGAMPSSTALIAAAKTLPNPLTIASAVAVSPMSSGTLTPCWSRRAIRASSDSRRRTTPSVPASLCHVWTSTRVASRRSAD
mmetsp:Transcript_75726/g.157826  ORF Transcript_75726/g.157826 Transcript_75726/m.157826 type:complete len:211 (+) Transcript_75726:385-1017(+)